MNTADGQPTVQKTHYLTEEEDSFLDGESKSLGIGKSEYVALALQLARETDPAELKRRLRPVSIRRGRSGYQSALRPVRRYDGEGRVVYND